MVPNILKSIFTRLPYIYTYIILSFCNKSQIDLINLNNIPKSAPQYTWKPSNRPLCNSRSELRNYLNYLWLKFWGTSLYIKMKTRCRSLLLLLLFFCFLTIYIQSKFSFLWFIFEAYCSIISPGKGQVK